MNQELFYLGEQIKHLTSTDIRLHLGNTPYGQPTDTADWSIGAGGDPYITSIDQITNDGMDVLIGFFEHDDTQDRYFMIQNTLHTHGENSSVQNLNGIIRVAFDFGSVIDPLFNTSNVEKINRQTGAWEALSLVPEGGNLYHFDFALSGGSADLFRYSFIDLPGDFDNDGSVTIDDYDLWKNTYGSTTNLAADGNGDGMVNAADYTVWKDHQGLGTSTATEEAATVPEPSSFLVLVILTTLGILRDAASASRTLKL